MGTSQESKTSRRRRSTKSPAWLLFTCEGLAEYYNQSCPFVDEGDFRKTGWDIGRQMVAQHLIETLLKIALERQGVANVRTHNVGHLYRQLAADKRTAVERRYKMFLNAGVEWTWDVYATVPAFLRFLGTNPMKGTRYPLQRAETLYSPNAYRPLIYSLFIELHNYPVKGFDFTRRYDTKFKSLSYSRQHERRTTAAPKS